MHIVEWSDSFALGIGEIDSQHRALVGMINALEVGTHGDDGHETTARTLGELDDYVREHFALEERLMAGGGCTPDLVARHCGEHAYFRGVLTDLKKDFAGGRGNISVSLIEYLVHWLLHHISVVDRAMATELNATEPHLAARVAAAMMQSATGDLSDSERHLLAELRRLNAELERKVKALTEQNGKLETELREAVALADKMSTELALHRPAA